MSLKVTNGPESQPRVNQHIGAKMRDGAYTPLLKMREGVYPRMVTFITYRLTQQKLDVSRYMMKL